MILAEWSEMSNECKSCEAAASVSHVLALSCSVHHPIAFYLTQIRFYESKYTRRGDEREEQKDEILFLKR